MDGLAKYVASEWSGRSKIGLGRGWGVGWGLRFDGVLDFPRNKSLNLKQTGVKLTVSKPD